MTSIVGVLNKHGVAIAADSAVTYSNTRKVVNSANKIFTLSKCHPVAVMTYDNASFMGVPWEIIIKEYRRELYNSSFPYLEDYVEDFISFIYKRNFFCDDATSLQFLNLEISHFYRKCYEQLSLKHSTKNESEIKRYLKNQLDQLIVDGKKVSLENLCPKFVDYSFNKFYDYSKSVFEEFAKQKQIVYSRCLAEAFFYYLKVKSKLAVSTGLVFVGFGEEEIFPSLLPLDVSIVIDNRLRFYVEEKNQ